MELNTAKLVVPVLEIVPIRLADLYPEILLIRLLGIGYSVQLFQLLKNSDFCAKIGYSSGFSSRSKMESNGKPQD